MTVTSRRFALWRTAAAELTAAAVGFASPAWADPVGTYIVTWSDGTSPSHWTFTPCGPGCSHVTGVTFSGEADQRQMGYAAGPLHEALCGWHWRRGRF